jgi:diketogulonate reductase-like aldo/keto reductase
MPLLGLGTLHNKGADGVTLVQAALAEGYRHLDTAEFYGNEDAVGEGLATAGVPRDDVWVTTKVLHPRATRPDSVRAAAEASLRRLNLDHVDLLLMHWPNPNFDIDDVLAVFRQLRDEGKTRFFGVSNFPSRLLQRALAAAPDLVVNQVEYHPLLDQSKILTVAREAGITIVAHSPLARGRVFDDPVLQDVATETGRTVAQVALRWLIQQEGIAAIPGGSPQRLGDLAENLACLEFSLTAEQMDRIAGRAAGVRIVDGEHAPDWDEQ